MDPCSHSRATVKEVRRMEIMASTTADRPGTVNQRLFSSGLKR